MSFLFPSTESGVEVFALSPLLPPLPLTTGVPPASRSLVASSKHVAWYTLLPTVRASLQMKSCSSSLHMLSNFSWQIGQGSLLNLASFGTRMKASPFFFTAVAPPAADGDSFDPSLFSSVGPSPSAYSLLLIHSRSSTYQLRWTPLRSASTMRVLVLKCQSR